MRIEEVKIYKFEELEKEVQEKVMGKWYEEEDYPFLEDDLEESLKCNEGNIFEDNFKIYYSFGHSQGDGLCIEGDIDIVKTIDMLFPEIPEDKKTFWKSNIYRLYSAGNTRLYSAGNARLYTYAFRTDIEFELQDDEFYKEFEENLLPVIQDQYMDLCNVLKRKGYGILEYRMSAEEFEEMCEINNYEFYANGKMF